MSEGESDFVQNVSTPLKSKLSTIRDYVIPSNEDLGDPFVSGIIKNSLPTIATGTGSIVANRIAENTYGRPNEFEPIATLLHNPDYLTSFAYPFTMMVFIKSACEIVKVSGISLTKNEELVDKTMDLMIKIAPIITMSLNVWHELSTHPTYQDNPGVDILAGAVAGLAYVLINRDKYNFKRDKTEK